MLINFALVSLLALLVSSLFISTVGLVYLLEDIREEIFILSRWPVTFQESLFIGIGIRKRPICLETVACH